MRGTIPYSASLLFFRILDALAPEADVLDDHDDCDSFETASVIITSNGRPASAILGGRVNNYESYRHRLEPLVELEERLIRLLSSPDEDEPTHLGPTRPMWEQYAGLYNNENLAPPVRSASIVQNGRPAPTIMIPQKKQTSSASIRSIGVAYPASYTNGVSYKGKEIEGGRFIDHGV